ncbi:multiple epidermal growth factor-like domains protein 10 isoform X3 [Patella vulgata]|uniref:multiple epidermal growth factor-like domains protein 10 isoform X3 n=1 Tax=Patella vulgata TaxID=6465 RepID=UPI0024A96A3E|nr:multiple epidermal growth factor-like domains protein 10 isoform X3 [Patella vulgata]
MIFPHLSKVIILSTVLHTISALDVCRDTINSNCQSCDNTVYPIDDVNRQNCMRSCGVCTDTNIALDKPTGQSSTFLYGSSFSSNAVDGNTDNDWGNGHCTHTNNNNGIDWWCVDLQQIYNIDRIKLFNRDQFQGRLSGFELKISSVGQCNESGFISATSCYKDTPPTTQDIYTIDRCNQQQSLSARTVFVRVNNDEVVSLCEVQIFTVQCNTGYYSTSSSTCQPCDKCLNNTCDATTGVCTDGCKDGYYDDKCTSPCSDKCTNSRCYTNPSFSQPQCTDGCVGGYKGSYCQTSCPGNCRSCQQDGSSCIECNQGWYGTNCESQCPDNCVGGCEKIVEGTSISPIVSGIIGVLCGIVGTVAVGVSYHFYKKRRQSSQPKAENDPDYVYSNTDLNPTTSTTDDTLTTGYQNIPTNTRNVDYVNQSFNTEDNTRNMYDTLDLTPDNTQHTYTTLGSNKVHKAKH